jgi:protocatechuate 3,4-dioxygenase beta subunit
VLGSITASASEQITVTGLVQFADGTPARADEIDVIEPAREPEIGGAITEDDGSFAIQWPANTKGSVGYYTADGQSAAPMQDGFADVYSLGSFDGADSAIDLGEFVIPTASILDVRVTDPEGTPVEDAIVTVRHRLGGWGTGPAETNQDGLLAYDSFDGTGIEVTGGVRVEVEPPADSDRFLDEQVERELTVTADTVVELTLQESEDGDEGGTEDPVALSGQVVYENGTPASNQLVELLIDGAEFVRLSTGQSGGFETTVPADATVRVGYYSGNQEQEKVILDNGFADVYSFGAFEVGSEPVELGELTVPAAKKLTVQVQGRFGLPVPGATVSISHRSGDISWGTGPIETNQLGLLDDQTFFLPGIEVSGDVTVSVEPPADDDRFPNETVETTLTVTDDEFVTPTLEGSILDDHD